MTSVFVSLADLAKLALAPDGSVSTSRFLELCRQVLPIIGPCENSLVKRKWTCTLFKAPKILACILRRR